MDREHPGDVTVGHVLPPVGVDGDASPLLSRAASGTEYFGLSAGGRGRRVGPSLTLGGAPPGGFAATTA